MRLILFLFVVIASSAGAQDTVAFFGLHLKDSSGQTTQNSALTATGSEAEDLTRTVFLEDMLARHLVEEGYRLLDLAPVAEELERVTNPANCYGCNLRMAETLKADSILVGETNKILPALVLIDVQLRDGTTSETVKGGTVSVRGNTDEIWARGMRQVLNNRIFKEETQ